MKSKFTLLIIISAMALLALCGIQAYLINNTYELKKEAFFREADQAVSEISNGRVLDSIYDFTIDENLADHLADYINGRIDKKEVYRKMQVTANALNPMYIKRYEEELRRKKLGYEIKHQLNLISVVKYSDRKADTIFPITQERPERLFGQSLENDNIKVINKARMFTTNEFIRSTTDSIYSSSYDLEVRTQERIVVKNWRSIVWGRMWVLMLGSILLFLFVIGLLYYSIKNLITQKKIAEVKTDFINNVTHELKTPLATLGIATKSLRNNTIRNNPEAFANTLGIVERQNSRLQKLIDQVLTNSLSAEEIQLHKEQVADNEFFKNLIFDFKTSTQNSDLKIVTNIYEPEVLLRVDRFHLTTALGNILENAVKYATEPVAITVNTTVQNRQYRIEIQDNGMGILEADQKAIFDKFYRAGNSTVHNVKGLGLGLYFSHQIITAHDGTIHLKSKEGKGTTFIITLPL